MTLTFGKFKGQQLESTPSWYQSWLAKQDWFNSPKQETVKSLSDQLRGWNGHSRKGEAIYDKMFELEKAEGDRYDDEQGFYKEGGMYYGLPY